MKAVIGMFLILDGHDFTMALNGLRPEKLMVVSQVIAWDTLHNMDLTEQWELIVQQDRGLSANIEIKFALLAFNLNWKKYIEPAGGMNNLNKGRAQLKFQTSNIF